MRSKKLKFILLLVLLTLVGCGEGIHVRQVEDYGDVVQGPGGIQLVSQSEHAAGWGRRDCLLCHNAVYTLHRNVNSNLDAEAMTQTARSYGESYPVYCLSCHGPNGVE